MAVLPKVKSALFEASQLPGEGPTDVKDALIKTRYHDDGDCLYLNSSLPIVSGPCETNCRSRGVSWIPARPPYFVEIYQEIFSMDI